MTKWDLKAKDCSPFDEIKTKTGENNLSKIIEEFITQSKNCYLKFAKNDKDDEPVALFDYKQNSWIAGRYIGKMTFLFEKHFINVEISPRFGDTSLIKMLETIHNIKIPKNKTGKENTKEETWVEKIIGLIWLKQLADANRFGLPRTNIRKTFKGFVLKGRLNVRESMKPFFHNKNIVSEYYMKHFDETIFQILSQAYKILSKNFLSIPSDSANDAINHLKTNEIPFRKISESEYKKIKYKSIYISFKKVVDLSWLVINNKSAFFDSNSGSKNSFGLFIDMAEIWELYLVRIIKDNFSDWKILTQKKYSVYQDQFYKRSIRPDIIMKKGNKIVVFDAKWKKMSFIKSDFDRSDFFQINTYISYLKNQKEYDVIAGGLLYPLEKDFGDIQKKHSVNWLNDNSTNFIVDGIQMIKNDTNNECYFKIGEFVDRMKGILNV